MAIFTNTETIKIIDAWDGVTIPPYAVPQKGSANWLVSNQSERLQGFLKNAGWTDPYIPIVYFPTTHPTKADAFPSVIKLPYLGSPIKKVKVTMLGLSHSWPGSLAVLLVSPNRQMVELLSGPGGSVAIDKVTLTFDDDAPSPLPSGNTQIVSGNYKPSSYYSYYLFDSPAPDRERAAITLPGGFKIPLNYFLPYPTNLSVFKDSDTQGEWKLFIEDNGIGGGSLAGWSLEID
jgi:hypothetical protein